MPSDRKPSLTTLKHRLSHVVTIPLPNDWELSVNGRSYAGPGGLVDVRIEKAAGGPVDRERLRLAKDALESREAVVELLSAQGMNCLHCRYQDNGCAVRTYSFDSGVDSEVIAVYAFRPGYAQLRDEVHSAILAPNS